MFMSEILALKDIANEATKVVLFVYKYINMFIKKTETQMSKSVLQSMQD